MDKVVVTSVTNAGVMVTYKNKKLLFDAIQIGNDFFSAPPEEMLTSLIGGTGDFKDVDVLAYSHYHNDHIDFEANLKYLDNYVPKTIVLPLDPYHRAVAFKEELTRRGIKYIEPNPAIDEKQVFEIDEDITITCYRSHHDGGAKFKNVCHHTFLLSIGGKNVLIGADSPIMECPLYEDLRKVKIDIALFNLLFLNNRRGREIINSLNPTKLAIYHLPLEGHVNTMFRNFAINDAEKFKDEMPPITVFEKPYDKVEI